MKQQLWMTVALLALAMPALAAPATLSVKVDGISADGMIGEHYASCKATEDGKSKPGDNARPGITWAPGPEGTKSYAVMVIDPDVPADFSEAGKDGHIIRGDAPRQQFIHWALVDVPATVTTLAGGDSAVAPGVGKQVTADLKGYVPDPKNFGGPCPPWNDERVHHYHFIVMALDVPSLGLPESASAKDVLGAALPHTLARGEAVGGYTLNPLLRNAK